jgi:hypothetical protein
MVTCGFPSGSSDFILAAMAVAGSSEFVGRGEELARLLAALEQAEQGRPAMVLLAGDAGVGKTRLLIELAEGVSRGASGSPVSVSGFAPDSFGSAGCSCVLAHFGVMRGGASVVAGVAAFGGVRRLIAVGRRRGRLGCAHRQARRPAARGHAAGDRYAASSVRVGERER